MSTIFLYEDGHGNVIDENGGPEPMDYIVDQNEFIVETYLGNAVPNESSLTCPMLLFDLKIEKCMTASAAAKQFGIHPRTAFRWVSQYNAYPQSIFESCILTEEHKTTVINFIN
ncbi:hypothetical protein K501DRAFT_324753 [Backusella circina FSU 941]|nr:hypothetical protein K501DRAFT_324753 [Backusella circina FSU 941]